MMDYMINTMPDEEKENVSVLEIQMGSYSGAGIASKVMERLTHASALLGGKGFIGMRLTGDLETESRCEVFSSKGANVTEEDYNWIFEDFGHIESGLIIKDQEYTGYGSRVYILQGVFLQSIETSSEYGSRRRTESALVDYFSVLMRMIHEMDASLEFRIGEPDIAGKSRVTVLISLSGEMPLRMKSVLAMTFPECTAIEMVGGTAGDIDRTRICSERLNESIVSLFRILMSRAEQRKFEVDPNSDEIPEYPGDVDDEEDEILLENPVKEKCSPSSLPIEEMELSVRAYNCLKRAGIHTVGQLKNTSDEELKRVRNLGRKSYDEVKEKLSEILTHISEAETEIPLTAENYMAMLDELIGLEDVKRQVKKIAAYARMKKAMPENDKLSMTLNMVFTGNPGTAKTTVARIVAGILHEVGILPENGMVEVGRADLIARYEGQTADKVKSVFDRAKGKVLFIDEAYSLLENWENGYGDEAISTIVQEMENNREDTVVIFAGYPDKMDEFFRRNPGMRSRVPFAINFKDYSEEEILKIAELEASKRGFEISVASRERVIEICRMGTNNSEGGNGRFSRNLVENAILSYASRVYGSEAESVTGDFRLEADDFEMPKMLQVAGKEKRKIGFVA